MRGSIVLFFFLIPFMADFARADELAGGDDITYCATVVPVCTSDGDAVSYAIEGRRDQCAVNDQKFCKAQMNDQLAPFAECLDEKESLSFSNQKLERQLRKLKRRLAKK